MSIDQHKEHSEQWLVQGLKVKDDKVFEMVYHRYAAALYGVIKRIVLDEKLAEEVTHDAFLKIWEKAGHYDPKKGRLFTWMLNLARNLAIDKTRSRKYKEAQKTDSQTNNVYIIDQQRHTKQNPEEIGVQELLSHLSDEQKIVVELLYFKGYSQSEVAKEFDMPLGTVKTRTRSALKRLRKIFKK